MHSPGAIPSVGGVHSLPMMNLGYFFVQMARFLDDEICITLL
jgi:hypothetical protein